jgi:predicted patatin/cPLA2 family phospholipase
MISSAIGSLLYGSDAATVIDGLNTRARRRETAATATDGRKFALIVEGGAMRGIISSGALLALEALGMTDVFDDVYGCSAGAINAAYFVAGQAAVGTTIYYEEAIEPRFLNPLRVWKIGDVDYLADTIISRLKPLDVRAVTTSPTRLHISITDARTAESLLVDVRNVGATLPLLLKASAAIPLLYNRVVAIDGRHCVDGGCANPLPVQEAIAGGATDLLVLLTRAAFYVEEPPTPLQRWLFRKAFPAMNDLLFETITAVHHRANAARDLAVGRRRPPRPLSIAAICPDVTDGNMARATRNRRRLKEAATASATRTFAAFGESTPGRADIVQRLTMAPRMTKAS